MELERLLKYIEKRLEPIFLSPILKSAWFVNIEGVEQENLAQISLIINNTAKGYRKELKLIKEKLEILKKDKRVRFQFNLYKITEYWDKLRSMDSDLYSEMRLSIILYDPSGFFAPMKVLLLKGKIPCTREAVQSIIQESFKKVVSVRNELKQNIISSIYSLTLDAAQAPIVLAGFDPPIPKKVPETLERLFVKKKLLDRKTVELCSNIIKYYKDVEHGRINVISGEDLRVFLEASERFIRSMELLMKKKL